MARVDPDSFLGLGSESLVPESPLLQFSSAGIDKSNLLETRIMLAPFCWALDGLHHQVYPGVGADIAMESFRQLARF